MSVITISLGWWLLPLSITAFVWVWYSLYIAKRPRGGQWDFGVDVMLLFLAALAATTSSWGLYFAILYFTK